MWLLRRIAAWFRAWVAQQNAEADRARAVEAWGIWDGPREDYKPTQAAKLHDDLYKALRR